MKIIFQKKILFFKIKNDSLNFYKIVAMKSDKKNNLFFFVFGTYFKTFLDVGLNVFGAIPYWFSRIVSFVNMRELIFFKIFTLDTKTTRLFKNYSSFFDNILKRTKQGYFLEFKIIGYFRGKRITLAFKKKKKRFIKTFILLYLGYSHIIYINVKKSVSFVRGKKRFMFFTSFKQDFESILKQIFIFKPFNIYKIKGIRTLLNVKKMKPGKQKQQKKVIKK